MNSPGAASNRSSLSGLQDLYDGNGLMRRERNFSGQSLTIPPFPAIFTQEELATYFQYFGAHKIRKSRIYQHLTGYQIHKMEEIRNYPDIDAQSSDTGWTALHWACKTGDRELVEVLVNQCRANPSIKTKNGSSPIHLAIAEGHHKIVDTLLTSQKNLISSMNDKTGWFPLHTAAYYKQEECINILVRFGADVLQPTEEISGNTFSTFHLAAHKQLSHNLTTIKRKDTVNRHIKRSVSDRGDSNTGDAEESPCSKTIIDSLLKHLKPKQMMIIDEVKYGSILHVLSGVDHHEGVKIITSSPFNHPVNILNSHGISPLLMALEARSLQSALELLKHDVDISLKHPTLDQTPLQILLQKASSIQDVHLSIVQLLLNKGADPTYTTGDSMDSPLYLATNTNLDVRLLEKFLDYLSHQNINVQDKYTGDTLLHHAVVNCEAQIIEKILDKGADVMLENKRKVFDEITNTLTCPKSDLALQVAITHRTSKTYFEALKNFGIRKIIQGYSSTGYRKKVISFLETHLVGCCKEMNLDFFRDLYHFLNEGTHTTPPPDLAELSHIVHYRPMRNDGSTFSKTALNWANENNDKSIALELLKLEKHLHHDRNCGLECLKETLSSDTLLPWILETYKSFYSPGNYQIFSAILGVFFELVMFSYLPFIYDYYSDVTLAFDYYAIAHANDSKNQELLWTCSSTVESTYLNSTCFEKYSSMDVKSSFDFAYWVTIVTIALTSLFYLIIIFKHSNPACLTILENKIKDAGSKWNLNNLLIKIISKLIIWSLAFLIKLVWPILHMVRKVRYNTAEKRSEHKGRITESDSTWNFIKSVENGLESSVQLCLQTWLLKPFVSDLTRWSTSELMGRSVTGIVNFITFDLLPACYIERALGKMLLTILFLALSVALMKSTKPGVGPCEKPLRAVPIFISILAQTVARIFAIRSLILLESPLRLNKYVVFLAVHFIFLFTIKFMFETRAKEKIGREGFLACFRSAKFQRKLVLSKVMNWVRFAVSGLSSSIIMIHLKEDDLLNQKRRFSFLSHTSFYFLILCENLGLTMLPLLIPSFYPEYSCFPWESHRNGVLWVLGLWIIGVLSQIAHYSWSHPWADLNGAKLGPRRAGRNGEEGSRRMEFVTRLCWKYELQRIMFDWRSVERVNYTRTCIEMESLKDEYESRKNSRSSTVQEFVSNGNGGEMSHLLPSR